MPVHINKMTQMERTRALESLIFLTEKKDGTIKGRKCANGSTQKAYTNKEDVASPTAATESILLTATIDAYEERDVMLADIPNAFVQTDMETADDSRVIMKIRGKLVDMLVSLDAVLYAPYITTENDKKILYVVLKKALYGTLQAAILFYKKLKNDLESIGFEVNPYDRCVANRMINGKQRTVTWHVDDLKSSHIDPKVNDEFYKWLETTYGELNTAPVKATRGKVHEYLAMRLDFTKKGKVMINMTAYVKSMIKDFPEDVEKSNYPWNDNLYKVNDKDAKLDQNMKEIFHTFVAKGLFLCKRGRPDIQPVISFLTTRVQSPGQQDWFKLCKMIGFLKFTEDDVLTLSCDGSQNILWYIDAAFGVHNDMKSHTGATMTLGDGAIQSYSIKQKINTRSSTEAELVSIDDVISKIVWTKLFLEAQGFQVKENIINRDNQSSMKLEMNGKNSSGKRTRHFNIKYFYITNLIERKEASIQFCPTDKMISDYLTKPTTGAKFHKFRSAIMNLKENVGSDSRSVLEDEENDVK
jgi:Reverse transcriptase (RNA-dependent DNA polymerase)